MALPTSGALSLNAIHIEADGTSSTTTSLNDTDIRGLTAASGRTINATQNTEIDFADFYGARGVTEIVIPTGTSNRTILKYATENASGYGGPTVYGYAAADGSSTSGSGLSGSNGLGFGNIQFNQYIANGGRTDGIFSYAGSGLTIAFQTTDGTDITTDPNQMNFSRIDVNRTASADPSYGSYGPAASYYLSSASITQSSSQKTIVLISWSSPQAMGKTGGGFYGNANATPSHTFVFV